MQHLIFFCDKSRLWWYFTFKHLGFPHIYHIILFYLQLYFRSLRCDKCNLLKITISEKKWGWVNVDVCEFTSACHVRLSIHICMSSITGNDGVGSGTGFGVGAGGCVGGESGWRVGQQVWIANPAAFCWRPSLQTPRPPLLRPHPHSCVNEEPVAGHIDRATRGQGWGRGWGVGEQDVGGRSRKGVEGRWRGGGEKWKREESPHGSSRKYCRVMKMWCRPRVRWRPSAAAQRPSRSERRGRASPQRMAGTAILWGEGCHLTFTKLTWSSHTPSLFSFSCFCFLHERTSRHSPQTSSFFSLRKKITLNDIIIYFAAAGSCSGLNL